MVSVHKFKKAFISNHLTLVHNGRGIKLEKERILVVLLRHQMEPTLGLRSPSNKIYQRSKVSLCICNRKSIQQEPQYEIV